MLLSCSNCGASKNTAYNATAAIRAVKEGWGSYGSALYCPACSATWDARNPGRPMAGETNTIAVIDKTAARQRRRKIC